jgi:tetratricopeptide (TPR) repeat protein
MGKNKVKENYKAAEDQFGAVEEVLSKTELFIEKNMKNLTVGFLAIVVLIVAYFSYDRFVTAPKEKAALNAIYIAQKYFERDSLDLALNGSGEFAGFLDVMDDYSGTKAGNLAKYYVGVIQYKKGEIDDAITTFESFMVNDHIVSSLDIGIIGDAYAEKGDLDKALTYYQKAIDKNNNEFIGPIYLQKIAWIYELQKDWENALSTYEKIKKDYPNSKEAGNVGKYIALAKAKLGK